MVSDGRALQGGSVNTEAGPMHELDSASLANNHCVIPGIAMDDTTGHRSSGIASETVSATSGFAFGMLDGLVASSICIGMSSRTDLGATRRTASNAGNPNDDDNINSEVTHEEIKTVTGEDAFHLPHHDHVATDFDNDTTPSTKQSPNGASCLYHCRGMVFVLSVQLRFRRLVNICSTQDVGIPSRAEANTEPVRTIQQCLDPESPAPDKAGAIVGLLGRQKFRLSRVANSRYRGLVLTLSHIPLDQPGSTRESALEAISTLQTLEVKTTITYTTVAAKMPLLRDLIAKVWPKPSMKMDETVSLALAWWFIADNARTCALTEGGWDELLPCSNLRRNEADSGTGIIVFLSTPISNENDPRGYKRFACPIKSVCARFLPLRCRMRSLEAQRRTSPLSTATGLDFMGGFKFMPGELDRRPLRRIRQSKEVRQNECRSDLLAEPKGELMALSSQSGTGIPNCSLADMLRYICVDLGYKQNSFGNKEKRAAPSLVRRLTGARFLGISFCKAQIQCSKCFQPLCRAKEDKMGRKKSWGRKREGAP